MHMYTRSTNRAASLSKATFVMILTTPGGMASCYSYLTCAPRVDIKPCSDSRKSRMQAPCLSSRSVHLTVGNRSGYRGNRSYRSGSVRKKLGNRSLTEPSKPLFSVYRSVLPVYRTGFGGLENRSGSGFLNPHQAFSRRRSGVDKSQSSRVQDCRQEPRGY
jgi:hypothetical protein